MKKRIFLFSLITNKERKEKLSTGKTNAARTRQNNKKQEKTLVCDEQLDDEVPKTDEHGILLGGRL